MAKWRLGVQDKCEYFLTYLACCCILFAFLLDCRGKCIAEALWIQQVATLAYVYLVCLPILRSTSLFHH